MLELDGSQHGTPTNDLEDVAPDTDLSGRRVLRKPRRSRDAKRFMEDPEAQEAVRLAIRDVLHFLYQKHLEVPYMAMYRKEV